MESVYAIILAGGTGTRLWPLSRTLLPKQLIALAGEESLLQTTTRRLAKVIPVEQVYTVTQKSHHFEVEKQLRTVDPRLTDHLVIEPEGRNTLPAAALGVMMIHEKDPGAIVGIFPSDHHIREERAFIEALQKGILIARDGYLVTFGVRPTHPATGYGYIEAGRPFDGGGAYAIRSFVEKPDHQKASRYLKKGNYYWNSGIFLFRLSAFQEELKRYQPKIYDCLDQIFSSDRRDVRLLAEYPSLEKISIDYGLMEKTSRGALIPVNFIWNDLGCWDSFYQVAEKDASENVTHGEVVQKDCKNSLMLADHGTIAAIGLENLVVIKTDDAVLVSSRHRTEEVREIVDRLKSSKKELATTHSTVRRPWGSFTLLEDSENYKIKRISVDPGQKLSLQKHRFRAEHWVVIQGAARVLCGDTEITLKTNGSIDIPQGTVHRLANETSEPLQIIEVQTGSYFGEDDIQRLDDAYGRVTPRI